MAMRVERAGVGDRGVELIQPRVAERGEQHPLAREAAVDRELHRLEVAVVRRVGRVGVKTRLRRARRTIDEV